MGEYVFLTFRTCLLISFLIICVSYLSIRTRLRAPPPAELDNHRHRSREHNLRFSKTVFIAIASSFVFWMPAFVVYSTRVFCQRYFTPLVFWLVDAMYLVNSMANPLVYSFRTQIFKDAFHKFWRKRQKTVRPVVQQNCLGFGLEGSFTPKLSTTIWTTRNGVITLWLYSIGDEVKALLEQITLKLKSTLLKGQNILALKCFIYASDFRVL